MTHERDVERLLDTWLSDGPTVTPDRVIDTVADRIAHQPQRPAWRFRIRRFPTMSTPIKLVAVGAALLAVLVGGAAFLGGGSTPATTPTASPTPSPSPTASPTPSPSPTASPTTLRYGTLEPGDYVARALAGDPMGFIMTVPAGWQGFGGWAISGPASYGAPAGIGIAFLHGPQVVDDPCNASGSAPSRAPTSPTVDDLVAALSARVDLQASGLTDTVLAGYSGKRLDLQLPAEYTCGQHYVFAEPQGFHSQGVANRWRVWVLDADGETAVVVLSDYAGTPAEDRAAAQRILDSLVITPN